MNQRELFVSTIKDTLVKYPHTILLLGDISTFAFKDSPRVINCGCGEQAMVGIAAGLALEGWYPIVHSIAGFILRRAYEQIAIDFGAQNLNGLFIGLNRYTGLGPTHDCQEWPQLAAALRMSYGTARCLPEVTYTDEFLYVNVDANL